MTAEEKLPQRVRAHVTGDRAVTVFNFYRRPEWVVNEVVSDYGYDLIISTEHEGHVTNLLLAQLKGSDSPDYGADGKYVNVEMKVATINYLLRQPCLTIVCICDTGKPDEPIYWIWLHEFIKTLKDKKAWLSQETVSIKIPTNNRFDRSACQDIEKYMDDYNRDQNIEKAILEVLQPAMGEEQSPNTRPEDSDTMTLVARKMEPFRETGLIEIIREEEDKERIETFSPEDQARFRQIQRISNALNEFRDLEAERVLSELRHDIETAADGIKAKYFNNLGVLYLHTGDPKKAIEGFEKAHQLRPKEHKYTTNLLATHFVIASNAKSFESSLPENWTTELDQVIADKPEFCPALRLKASWLSCTAGTKQSEGFLRGSPCWGAEKKACCLCLAEIFNSLGDMDNALRLLNEAEIRGGADDPAALSLYANTLLKKAIGFSSKEKEFLIRGPGPSKVDLSLLKEAAEYYRKALILFKQKAFPRISQATIINYTAALHLLNDLSTAEDICKEYLDYHPDDGSVHAALASCLVLQDKMTQAQLKHAEIAFSNDPSSANYGNLTLTLFQMEEFEKLIEHASKRENAGFANREEEAISLALAAIAKNEIGDRDGAQRIIKIMESKPDLLGETVFAKEIIAKKENASREELDLIFTDALNKRPEDPILLTHYVHSFGSLTEKHAFQVVSSIEKLRKYRQLMPREIYLLGEGFLLLRKPEDADAMLKSAIERYPKDLSLQYLRAKARIELGDEEGSFQLLKEYMEIGQKTFDVLHNLAFLAYETGRLGEAITFFERSLAKAKEKRERGLIHFYLYNLRKKRGDEPKKIVLHAIEYGKTVESVDEEARFLMMFLLNPYFEERDEEMERQVRDFQMRLKKFSEDHPRFHSFYSFKIPTDLPPDKLGFEILSQINEIMLPHYLATVPLRMSADLCNGLWHLVQDIYLMRTLFLTTGRRVLRLRISQMEFISGIRIMISRLNKLQWPQDTSFA